MSCSHWLWTRLASREAEIRRCSTVTRRVRGTMRGRTLACAPRRLQDAGHPFHLGLPCPSWHAWVRRGDGCNTSNTVVTLFLDVLNLGVCLFSSVGSGSSSPLNPPWVWGITLLLFVLFFCLFVLPLGIQMQTSQLNVLWFKWRGFGFPWSKMHHWAIIIFFLHFYLGVDMNVCLSVCVSASSPVTSP